MSNKQKSISFMISKSAEDWEKAVFPSKKCIPKLSFQVNQFAENLGLDFMATP